MRLRLQQVSVTSDLHALLHANADEKPGILVIAGTGASVLARNDKGDLLRSGGWGTLFGDEGSSYAISVAALRACARAIDKVAIGTALTERLPEEANLNSFNDFAAWSTCATKRDIAALTRVVAAVAEEGDEAARFCIEKEARQLAALTQTVRKQLKFSGDIRVFENGALFESCTLFRDTFRATDNYSCAMNHNLCTLRGHRAVYPLSSLKNTPPWAQTWNNSTSLADNAIPVTEQTSTPVFLDALSAQEIADAMHHADKEAVSAINDVLEDVTAAIEEAARSLCAGGRIIYTGAGTSGRLGVLDASECPPTFGVSPDRVVGIIAGG
ncbi:MAG: hypothetical protein KAH38_08260, partial [Candidatus Hydrogenedentes bacterium]|nr:hypothetical protein [Candidatus Hydrogenedentota bacterium]